MTDNNSFLAPPGYHWEFNDISGDFELVPDLGEYIQSTPPPDEDDLMQPVDISQVFPYDPEASEVAEPPAQRPRLAEPEPQLVLFPNVPAAVEPPVQRPEPQPQPQPAPIPRAVIVQPPSAPAPAPAPPQPARRYNLRTREDRERAQTRATLNRAPLNTHMIYTPLYTKLFEESDFPIMERRSNGRWYFSRLNYLRAIRYGGKLHDLYEKYTVEDGRALASIVDDHNTDGDKELKIPFDNVYNLKSSILFYIMDLISEDTEDRSYCALFSIDRRENQHRDRRRRGNQGVEYVLQTRLEAERGVEYNTIIALLLEILEKIWTDIGTTTRGQVIDTGIIWTRDTEMDSGDRLMIGDWVSTLNDPNKRSNLYIKLKFHLMNSAACSGHFSADVRKEVDEIFATGGVKVITNSDEMCLLYTILEGILMIEKVAGCSRGVVYETPEHVLAMSETYANESNQKIISELVLKKEVYKKIDENVGIRYSMNDFRRIMKEVEEELLGGSEYAIEIFLKVSKNEHVFPAYISERKSEKRIQIIGMSYGKINHFVLVVNPKSVWAMLGGKIFYTCSKCRKTFYTQSLLAKHDCEEKSGEYHWSRQGCDDDVDPVVGVCPKCCLKFDNEFAYEFHQKHCFMKGKSGYKQVVLSEKQYMSADTNQRMLMLELPKGHLYFADFESTISEEGDHTMMSFGLYGVNEQHFEIGYSMEEFMKAILRYSKENKKIKVYFHNAMNYDANFILREVISKPKYREWSIQVIMKSSNRMQKLSFMYQDGKTKRIIEIGDTFFFLSMSLEKICGSIRSESLSKNKVNFKRFFEEIQKKYSVNDEDADRILKKNLFPYRFFNDAGKLDTSIEEFSKIFEPREENVAYFSESVNVDDLSKNFEEFKYVCEKYRCESARDYHDIYLLCDVMQIADVFLATRQEMWDSNQIDLTKYIGMPAASWAAFLKFDPTLELPLYRDTLYAEFFSGMTRGGVTSAPIRFAKSDANHTILYLDVNGLYPHVMRSYSYPCGNLRFIKVEPWDDAINEDPERWLRWKFDMLRSENKGMCVYVDLHEPDDVKKMTDLYPFAPEHRTIHDQYFDADGQLYPFLQKWSEANEGEKMKSFYGLVGTHYDKKEYGVNWLLLEWYMNHGLRVTKVHYWVEYDERDYMAPYIGDNIERRNRTTTEVGKKVHKDKSNAAYGKTFENPLNHEKFVIVRGGEKLEGLLQTANVSTINCIDEKTYVVKLLGERVELDRPTYIGANVTEYAKLHMYTLYYDKLCKMFPAVELVYTDTDSFIVRVEHPEGVDRTNLLSYMNRDEEIIGNLGGQLKSETGDDFIDEVIALRSKVYAYRTLSGHIGKRAKGTTAAAQKNELDWETYKRALITLKAVPTTNVQFKRERFTINSQHLLKISLSANDGKRYILEDGIHTHAFGY